MRKNTSTKNARHGMVEEAPRDDRRPGYSAANLIHRETSGIPSACPPPFFKAVEIGEVQVVTSTLTLAEVLVYPYKYGNRSLAQQYSNILLHSRNLRTIPVSAEIAIEASRLRAAYRLKTPDSIQIATARTANATAFLTNDEGLAPVSGLQIITLNRVARQS